MRIMGIIYSLRVKIDLTSGKRCTDHHCFLGFSIKIGLVKINLYFEFYVARIKPD